MIEVFPNFCRVHLLLEHGGERLLCRYGKTFLKALVDYPDPFVPTLRWRDRAPVAVGDEVFVERDVTPDRGFILKLAARRNEIVRLAPGQVVGATPSPYGGMLVYRHVVAANVDELVIVASWTTPAFERDWVELLVIAARAAGVPASLCLTKVDLLPPDQTLKNWVDEANLAPLGIPIFAVGANKPRVSEVENARASFAGEASLRHRLQGRRIIFFGKSGVGKTSLLRRLLGIPEERSPALASHDALRVGELGSTNDLGRHTTTVARLFAGPEGAEWIDTPGVRRFVPVQIRPEQLIRYFPQIHGANCAQPGCLHLSESGCQAPPTADLARYRAFHQILKPLG